MNWKWRVRGAKLDARLNRSIDSYFRMNQDAPGWSIVWIILVFFILAVILTRCSV